MNEYYIKALKIIQSCKTLEQLSNAEKCILLVNNYIHNILEFNEEKQILIRELYRIKKELSK